MTTPARLGRFAALGLAAALLLPAAAPAQNGTPAAGDAAFPITPDPAGCQIEPRTTDELLGLWYTPSGSPVPPTAPTWGAQTTSVTLPVGPPADEATVAAVEATVREVFDCFAAGDFQRATALFTDDLVRGFGAEPGTTAEDARAFLEATPEPGAEGEAGEIVAVTDVMDLGEDTVGAFVVDRSGGEASTVYALFAREGDRLLVDEIFEFAPTEGDQAGAATPTP